MMRREGKKEVGFGGLTIEEAGELLKAYTEDSDWVESRIEHLRKTYPNMCIAVVRKRVVASSRNWEDVVAKLKEKNLEPNFVLVRYIPKNPVKYLLHI